MFGNSPFGFSGSGGGGGGGTIGGGGTLNYLCKFTPDGTTIGNSQLFDDGTSVGLGTITPTAKFQIYVDVNDITGQSGQLITNVNAGTSAAAALFFRNNDNKGFEIGVVSSNHTTYQDAYGRLSDSFYTSVVGGGDMIFKQRASGKGIKFFNAGNGVVTGQSLINVSDNGVGFYTDSISAVVHIKGVDATSGAYALKVDNSASSPILYARNNAVVGVGIASPTATLHVVDNQTPDSTRKVLSINDSVGTENLYVSRNVLLANIAREEHYALTGTLNIGYFYGGAGKMFFQSSLYASNILEIDVASHPIFKSPQFNDFYFDGSIGIGMTLPTVITARLHITGTDSTSSNYALKVDNSASSPLLYVRNDGNIGIGIASPTAKLHVFTNSTDYVQLKVGNSNVNYATGLELGTSVDNIPTIYKIGSSATGIASDYYNKMVFAYGGANNSITTDFVFALSDNLSIGSTFRVVNDGGNLNNGFSKTIFGVYGGVTNNSVGVGMGSSIPTAILQIKGVDSTSGAYALKVDNSSSSPLLYVRNDGNIGIGYSNPSFAKVQVENSINDLKASWFSINQNTGASSGQQIYMDNGVQSFSSGILGVSTINWNSYGNPKDAFIRYGSADGTTGNINFISPLSGLGGAYNFFAYRAVSGGIPTLGIKGSFISVNLDVASASANIHAKGDDSTSANFVLKADDSGNTNIIKARNDGYVIQRANNSAISDGSLANSELSFYIDEGGNTLTVKVKYSGGTIKTGTVALV